MNYTKKEMFSYNIHNIKTDRFKDTTIKFSFKSKYKKEDMAILNMLVGIVTYTSKNYKTDKEVSIKCEELYDTRISSNTSFYNDVAILTFSLSFFNEEYTKKGQIQESIKFFLDLLFNPNIENDAFIEKDFNIIREEMFEKIQEKKNNKPYTARDLMYKNMARNGEIFGEPPLCDIDDYKSITKESLYKAYKDMISNFSLDIFILSSDNHDIINDIFVREIPISTYKKKLSLKHYNHKDIRTKFKKVEVSNKSSQTNICIGYKISKLNDFEFRYVAWVFNMIFGADANSKLFQVIREKHNLAYTVGSSIDASTSILYISCGTSYDSVSKVVKYAKKCLSEMQDGKFSDEDINNAKMSINTIFDSIFDSRKFIINYYNGIAVHNLDELDVKREQIKRVCKKDIIKYAKKINPDTILVLKGENENEGN